MIYYLSIAGHEQEISLEALEKFIPVLLENGFGFAVRTYADGRKRNFASGGWPSSGINGNVWHKIS